MKISQSEKPKYFNSILGLVLAPIVTCRILASTSEKPPVCFVRPTARYPHDNLAFCSAVSQYSLVIWVRYWKGEGIETKKKSTCRQPPKKRMRLRGPRPRRSLKSEFYWGLISSLNEYTHISMHYSSTLFLPPINDFRSSLQQCPNSCLRIHPFTSQRPSFPCRHQEHTINP